MRVIYRVETFIQLITRNAIATDAKSATKIAVRVHITIRLALLYYREEMIAYARQ